MSGFYCSFELPWYPFFALPSLRDPFHELIRKKTKTVASRSISLEMSGEARGAWHLDPIWHGTNQKTAVGQGLK